MAVRRPSNERTYDLDGQAGNAYAVMGFVQSLCLQIYEGDKAKVKSILDEMTSGDYLNLLKVANREVGMFVTWITDNEEYIEVLK